MSSRSRHTSPWTQNANRQRKNHAGKHHHITVPGMKQAPQQPCSKQGWPQESRTQIRQRTGEHQQTGYAVTGGAKAQVSHQTVNAATPLVNGRRLQEAGHLHDNSESEQGYSVATT
ncbi:hypothetical protein KCP76_26080 (plasmid) [Salmonella enterica subsp. enterica serovar Weltevreden]|nr:hypothetical protein KCP76_26080 [Salmonella enterica subsp. enterica serovar Weltevreden]